MGRRAVGGMELGSLYFLKEAIKMKIQMEVQNEYSLAEVVY